MRLKLEDVSVCIPVEWSSSTLTTVTGPARGDVQKLPCHLVNKDNESIVHMNKQSKEYTIYNQYLVVSNPKILQMF